MSLLQTNATVSTSRGGTPVTTNQHIGVYIKKAGPMNLDFSGVQATTDLLADPGADDAPTSWRVNDLLHVESDGAYQVTDYTVTSAEPPRGLLVVWRIRVQGTIR